MMKATEDLKLQQRKKAEERQRVLSERIPELPDTELILRGSVTDTSFLDRQ